MSRPRNGILCPECRKGGRDVVCDVVKTVPVGSGRSRLYWCPRCGGAVDTHEEVVRYTPPIGMDEPETQQAPA